ncbi:MAG: LysR family transcriptional regulator [Gemmatimonadales bacterium]|nr:LysR family transcriptional regulator [Gemmatimonadales bacterium]
MDRRLPVTPNLRSWHYFLKVAELGSLTAAANDLQVAQPALSRHVGRMERELGVLLFVRHGRGLRLTDAGRLLKERIDGLLDGIANLREELGSRAQVPAGETSLGIPLSMSRLVGVPLIERYRARYPNVALRIIEGTSIDLRDALKSGSLDAAIITEHEMDAELAASLRVREPIVFVGPRDAGLDRRKSMPVGDIIAHPLISLVQTHAVRQKIIRHLARSGVPGNWVVQANSLIIIPLVQRGIGYSLLPSCALAGSELRDTVSMCPIRGVDLIWHFVVRRAHPRSSASRALEAELTATVHHLVRTGEWTHARILD